MKFKTKITQEICRLQTLNLENQRKLSACYEATMGSFEREEIWRLYTLWGRVTSLGLRGKITLWHEGEGEEEEGDW